MKKILKNLDDYLNKIPKSQIIMLYLAILLAGASILYNTLPDMMDKNNLLKEDISNLQRNIRENSIERLKVALQANKKILLQEKSKYLHLKQQSSLLISKLYSLKFAFFDEKEWLEALEKILKQSVKYGIKINYVKNEDLKEGEKIISLIKEKKSVEIEAVGQYANLVKYLEYIESIPMLSRFENIHFVKSDNKVKATMIFDAFGVGL